MRTIDQYNDFVRRKCELANRRVAPPKAPNRQPEFVRARDGFIGGGRVVGESTLALARESLTDVPLIGFVRRLDPEAVEEEVAKAKDQETQAPLIFTDRAQAMLRRAEMTEQEVRDHLDEGVIEQKINSGHINKILEARKHLHVPHAH